jgi:antitoxin component of MazEF toxin-antitoxin module
MEGKRRRISKVGEAAVAYSVEPPTPAERGLTRLSAKNQITLPVAMVRALGWRPGDEIDLMVWDGAIHVRKQLRDDELIDWLQGSMAHVREWSTKEGVDEYVRKERDSWERDWDRD